jgi:hypothetical protein
MDQEEINNTGEVATTEAPIPAPEAVAEPTEAMTPEAAEPLPPKHSEAFRNRIKNAYPDQDFTDDEAYFQKANEQFDKLEQFIDANEILNNMFEADPVILDVLRDFTKGASFRQAIALHFSPEELMPQPGDPDEEGWKNNSAEREKKLADTRASREQFEKSRSENEEFTTKEIRVFAEKNNISPDKAEEELSKIGEVLDEAYSGRISSNLLQTIYQGIKHDSDVETAMSTGQIAGRNEKIIAQKQEKSMGDGLPVIKGNDKAAETTKKKDWVSELVDHENKRQIL